MIAIEIAIRQMKKAESGLPHGTWPNQSKALRNSIDCGNRWRWIAKSTAICPNLWLKQAIDAVKIGEDYFRTHRGRRMQARFSGSSPWYSWTSERYDWNHGFSGPSCHVHPFSRPGGFHPVMGKVHPVLIHLYGFSLKSTIQRAWGTSRTPALKESYMDSYPTLELMDITWVDVCWCTQLEHHMTSTSPMFKAPWIQREFAGGWPRPGSCPRQRPATRRAGWIRDGSCKKSPSIWGLRPMGPTE